MPALYHVYNQTVADGTATSVVRPSDWNSAHQISQTISGNTSGTSTVSGTNIVWAGGNNVTLAVATAASLATISINAMGATKSWYENLKGLAGTSTMQPNGSSHYVFPFEVDQVVSASYARFPVSWAMTSTSLGTSAAPTSTTFSVAGTFAMVIYTQGVGANSRSLQYLTSGQANWTWQCSVTEAGATNNWTITNNITWPQEGGTTSSLASSYASTLSTINASTTGMTNWTGSRYLDVPFAASLSPGNYWMAINQATTTGGGKGINWMFTNVCRSQENAQYAIIGQATNSSNQHQFGLGSWSTNASGVTTASIALANISSVANQQRPYFQFIRQV